MSELTPCNFCNLRSIRRYALKRGKEVTMLPSTSELGGIDVYVHPPDTEINTEKHFNAWFMALTDYCCC